ncbi:MAG TPA: LuxR C-terminal-related transcriptional regulator [Streptosporangiaceae bacterium]
MATVEAADAATSLTDLPALLLPALMDAVGADSALWTELDEAGPPARRAVSCPGRLPGQESAGALERHVLAVSLRAGSLYVRISLNRGGPDFTADALDLLTQLRPLLTRRVVRLSAGPAGLGAPAAGLEPAGLTGREQEVLSLVAEGLTDAAIGRRLGCSPRTVDKHLEHVYRRLGVSCRTAAVAACQGR